MPASAVALAGIAQEPNEVLTFSSRTPNSFSELLAGGGGASQVGGYLFLPRTEAPQFPVVVVSIGSRGFESGREELYAEALTTAGYAVFIGDSFGARGFVETRTDQSRLSAAGTCADALAALTHLAEHPRIDAARAAVLGYSRGGTVSALLADKRLQGLLPAGLGFRAHVALYPSCSPQWEDPHPTGAPVLMLLGGADRMAPPAKSRAYSAKLIAAGCPIEIIEYPDAHHSFDAKHAAKEGEGIRMPDVAIKLDDAGNMFEETTGLKADQGWAPFYRELARRRGLKGSYTGNGPHPRDVAVAPITAFLEKALKRR